MSTADDIRKMTQNFVENKSQSNLQNMSLEVLSQNWASAKKEPDFEQQKQNLSQSLSDEILQNKISEYMTNLEYGRFSPADFPNITEFCEEFGYKNANTDLKSKIDNLKETMETCRLNMPKELTVKFDDQLKAGFPLPHLDQVTISGNVEQLKNLEDKKSLVGKNFTFTDDNKNLIGGVEYDDKNNAHILCTNSEGNVVEYKLSPENKLYRVNDDKTEQEINLENKEALSTQDIRAYNIAKSSQKVWKKFINKELDKNIQKPTTKFNEGGIKTTKVNEGEAEENIPAATKFDEGESKKKEEGELGNEDANRHAFPNNDFQWKEDDIIKVMFQDWFLAAANSATNFALNHIEYAAAGIWDTIQSSYRNRKSDDDTPKKEEKKPDITHQFFNGIEDISQQSITNLQTAHDNQAIVDQVKGGNVKDTVIQNDLLRDFAQQTGVDVEGLLKQGEPEKTVPLLTTMAALYAKYTDTYAKASILDEKMHDHHSFENVNPDDLYAQKRTEGGKILKRILYEGLKENPENNSLKFFQKTLEKANKDMDSAYKTSLKDYDKENYSEHGKTPKDNTVLHAYQENLNKQEPTSLYDFAREQSDIIRNRDYITQGFNMEKSELDAAEQSNFIKRQNLKRTKDFITKGLDPNKKKDMINITDGMIVPLRPQGRE